MTEKSQLDVHVHLAALPDGQNGCLMSDRMRGGIQLRMLSKRFGFRRDDPTRANAIYLSHLVRTLEQSKYVRQAVLLGMDGIYDAAGVLDRAQTEFLISNDLILDTVKQYPHLFKAGVSVNPQRKDAIQELERCAAAGAYLVKVLPNTQKFNPSNPTYVPFYKALARLKLPLLCHVGHEFTLKGKDQFFGDPKHFADILDLGVTVIAAHGMSSGLFLREKHVAIFKEYVRKYPRFYWDASALSLPNRVGMLWRLRHYPELHARMLFGTDYPLVSFAFPVLVTGRLRDYLELRGITNSFDRHYRLLQLLGFPDAQELVP
jgi:predicted TIM-barrel fold metal-dependent hydrolase